MCSPLLAGANTRSSPTSTLPSVPALLLQERLRHPPVTRELQNTVVWLSCGFDRPPPRDAVDRFLTDLEHVVDEVFDRLVEQAACRGLLDLTFSIDSTDVRTMPADQDASNHFDPMFSKSTTTATAVGSSRPGKIPIAADSPRASKRQRRWRCASNTVMTRSPSRNSIWMLGDSAYDTQRTLHDHLLAAGSVPVAPYNAWFKHRRSG